MDEKVCVNAHTLMYFRGANLNTVLSQLSPLPVGTTYFEKFRKLCANVTVPQHRVRQIRAKV